MTAAIAREVTFTDCSSMFVAKTTKPAAGLWADTRRTTRSRAAQEALA